MGNPQQKKSDPDDTILLGILAWAGAMMVLVIYNAISLRGIKRSSRKKKRR